MAPTTKAPTSGSETRVAWRAIGSATLASLPAPLRHREPFPENRLRHRRDIEMLRIEQPHTPRHPGDQGIAERIVPGECLVLEPETEDDKCAGRAVELRV